MNEQLSPPAAIENPRFEDPSALDFGQSSGASDGNLKELQVRTTLGRWISAVSLLSMLGVFGASLVSLARLPGPPPNAAPAAERFFYVHLGLHAVLTGAVLYLLYQLLRAGERMMIPAWWDEKPAFVALMLGIKSPIDNVESVVDLAEKLKKLNGR